MRGVVVVRAVVFIVPRLVADVASDAMVRVATSPFAPPFARDDDHGGAIG